MGMMIATAAFAAVFLVLALFLWLEPQFGGPGAALSVAGILALLAGLLFYQGRPNGSNGAAASAQSKANQASPAPPSLADAGEALALARWVVRERPLMAMAVFAGAGYVLVRHPRAVGDLVATAANLLKQQAGLGSDSSSK